MHEQGISINLDKTFKSSEIPTFRLTKQNIKDFNLIKEDEMSIFTFLKNRQSSMSLLANTMAYFNLEFYGGFLALRMHNQYGIPNAQMGYIFMCATLPYFVGCLIYPQVFSRMPAKLQFVISFLVAGVAIGTAGTTPLFGLPDDQLWIVIVGLFMLGLSIPFIFINTIPETIDSIRIEYKLIEGINPALDSKINDISSLLTLQGTGIAGFIGPVLGGILYDLVDYKATMTIVMCFEFLITVLFAYFNCGLKVR